MRPMNAKYPGTCKKCGGRFAAGTRILWGSGTTEHESCPSVGAPSPARVASAEGQSKTNQKAAACDGCGLWLAPGEGSLVYCHEDGGCVKHFDRSGWHVYCVDTAGCTTRKAELRAVRAKEIEDAKAKDLAAKAAKAEQAATYQKARSAIVGMEAMTCHLDGCVFVREVAKDDSGFYKQRISEYTLDGVTVYCEEAHGYDDHRYTWLVPPDIAKATRLAYAAKLGITIEKARDWIAQYKGCHGQDIYQAVVDASM